MATPQIWAAEDITTGVLKFEFIGTMFHAMQGYSFIDGSEDIIEDLPGKTLDISVEFSTLPTNIQDALTLINDYMYDAALVQEGMD